MDARLRISSTILDATDFKEPNGLAFDSKKQRCDDKAHRYLAVAAIGGRFVFEATFVLFFTDEC